MKFDKSALTATAVIPKNAVAKGRNNFTFVFKGVDISGALVTGVYDLQTPFAKYVDIAEKLHMRDRELFFALNGSTYKYILTQDAYKGETLRLERWASDKAEQFGDEIALPSGEFAWCIGSSLFNIDQDSKQTTLVVCDKKKVIYTYALVNNKWKLNVTSTDFRSVDFLVSPHLLFADYNLWQLTSNSWEKIDPPSGSEQISGLYGRVNYFNQAANSFTDSKDGMATVFVLHENIFESIPQPYKLDTDRQEQIISIKIDKNATPYLLTKKSFAGNTPLFLYKWNGSTWEETPTGITPNGNGFLGLTFSEDNSPIVLLGGADTFVHAIRLLDNRWLDINTGIYSGQFSFSNFSFTLLPGERLSFGYSSRTWLVSIRP